MSVLASYHARVLHYVEPMIHRFALVPLLIVLTAPTGLAGQSSLGAGLDAWYAKAGRSAPGVWGVVVADQSGSVLWSVNASQPLIPASTVKLLTTGFARTVVGSDARRATRVVGTGQVNRATGTWEGGWALELNGDPTLERPDRTGPTLFELAEQLASIGVRRLAGPLTITTSSGTPTATYPSVWAARHRGRLFAPPVGPVTLNENVVGFTISPGSRAGHRPIIVGEAPTGIASLVTIQATTVAGRRSTLKFVAQAGGRYVVTGRIGVRAGSRRYVGVAADPKVVLDAAWRAATKRAGIEWLAVSTVGAPPTGPRRVLAEIASEPFDSIAHEVNTRSVNIGAELLLLWGGGPDRAAERLTQHVRTVTGITQGVHLVDGSGLSSEDRVSPLIFTTYLARFPLTPAGKNFAMLLPANGSGTLRRLKSGLPGPGVVRAKTGTLSNASTLVGYLGRSEGTLLVAVMYNGPRTGSARLAQWELFRQLGANGVVIPIEPTTDDAVMLGGGAAADSTRE